MCSHPISSSLPSWTLYWPWNWLPGSRSQLCRWWSGRSRPCFNLSRLAACFSMKRASRMAGLWICLRCSNYYHHYPSNATDSLKLTPSWNWLGGCFYLHPCLHQLYCSACQFWQMVIECSTVDPCSSRTCLRHSVASFLHFATACPYSTALSLALLRDAPLAAG